MSLLAQLCVAMLLFTTGVAAGIKIHAGQDAIAAQAARELVQSDQRQNRQLADRRVLQHLTQSTTIAQQLGAAREQIAHLAGRTCLDADTVRLLNNIGAEPLRAPASSPAGATVATAAHPSDSPESSDIDVAQALAQCRSAYAQAASQLNAILDIEATRRH